MYDKVIGIRYISINRNNVKAKKSANRGKIRRHLSESLLQILEFVRYSSVRCECMLGIAAHIEE